MKTNQKPCKKERLKCRCICTLFKTFISYSYKLVKTCNQNLLSEHGPCRAREDSAPWSAFFPAAGKELILVMSFWTQHREGSPENFLYNDAEPSSCGAGRGQPGSQLEVRVLLPASQGDDKGHQQAGTCSFSSTSLLCEAAAVKLLLGGHSNMPYHS